MPALSAQKTVSRVRATSPNLESDYMNQGFAIGDWPASHKARASLSRLCDKLSQSRDRRGLEIDA
jgi:hypothetical protein